MYLSTENKKKLILISIVIALSTISLITGKTIANTIILSDYSTKILPYFYFTLSVLTIVITWIASKYQRKNPQNFAFMFKLCFLGILLLFMAGMHWGGPFFPFMISILLLVGISFTTFISWSYAADIFDLQEFKRYSKVMQTCSTLGAITSGVIVGVISSQFNPTKLLGLIFFSETISIFLILKLNKYLSAQKPVSTTNLKLAATMKQNLIFKYLALMSLAVVVMGTLIDYNLKLELVKAIDKKNLAFVYSIIFVVSTTCILIVQSVLIEYLLRVFGSKKIILIYPLGILIIALIALLHFNFIMMAILFIISDILTYTTLSLSRNLYLNILPQAIKNLSRMNINGIIIPLAVMLSSFIVFFVTLLTHRALLSLVLIILCSIWCLYLAKVLIKNYRVQLTQSLYLRRFNSDLINMAQVDNKDIEFLLKQALSYTDPESTLFVLQIFANDKTLYLTRSLIPLLIGNDTRIVKEIAKILSSREIQESFIEPAKTAFLKSDDDETKWFLTLFLIQSGTVSLIPWVNDLSKKETGCSLAIVCFIYLRQGDLEQQVAALRSLINMFHSQDLDQKKWFLYVLKEISILQKEKYLTQYIDQNNPALQILALQQIGTKPSMQLLDSLVAHLGEPNISQALNISFMAMGDNAIAPINMRLNSPAPYPIKSSCIRTLSLLNTLKAEQSLMNVLMTSKDVIIKTTAAKYIAYRGVKLKLSEQFNNFLIQKMKTEVQLHFLLSGKLVHYNSEVIRDEINSRLQFIKIRVLYYSAALIGSMDILSSVSLLAAFHPDKNQQAIALELIDATAENREVSSLLMTLFIETKFEADKLTQPIDDPWLSQFIQDIESHNMDSIYTFTKLRKVHLFKDLAAETLQVLAQCCTTRDMAKDEIIFSEDDVGDGLFIIDSGEVSVIKQGIQINTLKESDYFGELALVADMPRFATIKAISEGVLFYIDKQDFDRITDEVPEIMKSINKQVIKYLIQNAAILLTKES